MRTKLLRSSVEKLEQRDVDYDVQDAALTGLAVRVRPSGSKTYIVRYRPKGGGRTVNMRTLTLGRHPILTPEQAREMAREALARVAGGHDPRPGPDARVTVATVLERHLEALKGRPSWRVAEGDIRLHLRPAIGRLLVSELNPGHVEAMAARLTKAGKERRAGACITLLRAALRRARLDDSAAKQVKAPGWRKRSRRASHEELAAILLACRKLLREGAAWPWSVYLVLLLILTGARPSEIRTARWNEVDLQRRLLVRRRHKLSHKTDEPREIELSEAACRIIEAMPRIASNPYLIPGRKDGQHLREYNQIWFTICEDAGVKGLWLYDLRRTFASLGLGRGFTLDQLGEALGHADPATTAGYARLLPRTRRSIAEAVAAEIDALGSAPAATPPEGRGDTSGDGLSS